MNGVDAFIFNDGGILDGIYKILNRNNDGYKALLQIIIKENNFVLNGCF